MIDVEKMGNGFDDLIFYDMQTGKIVNDIVYRELANKNTQILKDGSIGFISRKQAQISNNYVINRPKYTDMRKPQNTTPSKAVAAKRVMSDGERRNYQNAKNQSHPPVRHTIKRNRNNRKQVSKTVMALGMTAIIALSAHTAGSKLIQNLTEKKHLNIADEAMSSLLVQPNSRLTPDIVERNTHRTDDFQGYWYDNNGIAEDILKLPDEIFDAALYDVYVTMGSNRKNNYINNLDYIISGLSQNATPENNPLAFARVSGCMTFNEFLEKNGLVDDKRLPSEDKYVEFGKNAIEMYYKYLSSIEEDRNNGTDLRNNANNEALAYGGR